MDPLSIIASSIAIYQLASAVKDQCVRYARGVKNAGRDGDLVIGELDNFQRSLLNFKGMLSEEAQILGHSSRLKYLDEIMNAESISLKMCERDLKAMQTKLVKAQSSTGLKEAFQKLSWPLKQEDVSRVVISGRKFVEAVERTLNMDTNSVVREIDSTTKQIRGLVEISDARQRQEDKLRKEGEERQRVE